MCIYWGRVLLKLRRLMEPMLFSLLQYKRTAHTHTHVLSQSILSVSAEGDTKDSQCVLDISPVDHCSWPGQWMPKLLHPFFISPWIHLPVSPILTPTLVSACFGMLGSSSASLSQLKFEKVHEVCVFETLSAVSSPVEWTSTFFSTSWKEGWENRPSLAAAVCC